MKNQNKLLFRFYFALLPVKNNWGKKPSKLLRKNVLFPVTRVLESWPKVGNFFSPLRHTFNLFSAPFFPPQKVTSQIEHWREIHISVSSKCLSLKVAVNFEKWPKELQKKLGTFLESIFLALVAINQTGIKLQKDGMPFLSEREWPIGQNVVLSECRRWISRKSVVKPRSKCHFSRWYHFTPRKKNTLPHL